MNIQQFCDYDNMLVTKTLIDAGARIDSAELGVRLLNMYGSEFSVSLAKAVCESGAYSLFESFSGLPAQHSAWIDSARFAVKSNLDQLPDVLPEIVIGYVFAGRFVKKKVYSE